MNIKEMLIYDLDKLTREEIANLYKYVRRSYFAQIPGREPVKLEDGWPNTDEQGRQLYDNTSFKTRSEAIIYTLSELGYGIKYSEERIADLVFEHNKEVDRRTEMLKKKEMFEKELQDSNIKIQSREEKHEG